MIKMCSEILIMKNTILVWKIQIFGCPNTILGFFKVDRSLHTHVEFVNVSF